MSNYYSQHGEDFLLDRLFREKVHGFFVEIGCIDGKRFSNTLTFEEKGWNGLCIEAHANYIELLKKNRPHSIICHCAVGEKDEESVIFYANSRGSLSTLDPSMEAEFRTTYGKFFTGFEQQSIPKRRLDTIFKQYGITTIDFISIDVEGYEVQVLQGIDLKTYQPTVFVIESDSPEHEKQLDSILIPNGYIKSVHIETNIFYLREPRLEKRIRNKSFHITLTHTAHPLDSDEDEQISTVLYFSGTPSYGIAQISRYKEKLISLIGHLKRKSLSKNETLEASLESRFVFFELGFHGDQYLLEMVKVLCSQCNYFIETGTNVGSTCAYTARTYPHMHCFSCEPDSQAFLHALKNTKDLDNLSLSNETSQNFLKRLIQQYSFLFKESVVFWLDLHGYGFEWPLKQEIAFITKHFYSAYILIDDFKVPELPCFGYDSYQEQECSFEYIKDALHPKWKYTLYYPNYTERTSSYHPLRGWGLLEYGHENRLILPDFLHNKVSQIDLLMHEGK